MRLDNHWEGDTGWDWLVEEGLGVVLLTMREVELDSQLVPMASGGVQLPLMEPARCPWKRE